MTRIANHSILIICLFFGFTASAQQANFYKECYPCNLKDILVQLEERYDYNFSYNADKINEIQIEGELESDNVRQFIQYALESASLQPIFISDNEVLIVPIKKVEKNKAQELFSICGKIRDLETKSPLPSAVIVLNNTGKGVYAKDNGSFNMAYSFQENDSITASYLGYDPVVIAVKSLMEKPCKKIFLKAAELLLDDILVEEEQLRLMEEGAKANEIIIRHDRMGDAPGLGEPDVLRIVQMLPGISSSSGLAGQLNIRGGTPDENLILWDDIPIYHIGHFFGIFSPFNPYVIDEVSVFKGDFGVEYGDRNSGVIDIKSRPGKSGIPSFGIGSNGLNSHAYFELPLFKKKGGMLLAARKSYANSGKSNYTNLIQRVFGNDLLSNRQDVFDSLSNSQITHSFSFQDLNGKIFYQPNKKRSFSISIFAAQDDILFNQSNQNGSFFEGKDRLTMVNGGLSLKYNRYWNDFINTEFGFVSSNFRNTSLQLLNTDTTLIYEERTFKENYLSDNYLKIHNQIKFKRHEILFGWKAINQQIQHKYDYTHYHKEPVIDNSQQTDLFNTVYFNYRANLDKKFIFDLGIRFDQIKSFELVLPAPRYSISMFPLGPDLKFKSSGGFYRQYIRQYFESDELGLGNYFWLPLSDEYDKPVKTFQWSNGFTYVKNGLLIDAEFYIKRTEDIAHRDIGNREEIFLSFGNANIYGLDVLVKKQFRFYSSWLAYSLNKTTYRFPYFEDPFPASHDQRHIVNWTNYWTFRNFDVSIAWNIASGRPYTPAIGFSTFNSPVTGEEVYEIAYGPINSERYPYFSRIDFSANYKLVKRLWRLKIGMSVMNVLNQENILNTKYSVLKEADKNPELISRNRHLIPFTPNLFAIFEFN